MKQVFGKAFVAAVVCLSFAGFTFAQAGKKSSAVADMYVITAKAGVVNLVSGGVSVHRANETNGALIKGAHLETGDTVKSSADGKAEILLNPGSFVRLAENSEFTFTSNSLDDLQVKILRGSAMFEVVATKDFKVAVTTPQSGFNIVKSGIYRVDVDENGTAKLEVWKGKAQLNNVAATVLKGGQSSALNAGQIAAVKFDRDDKDAFELWSRDRAKELAKLNAALLNRQMSNSLLSYSRGFGFNGGFGLWIQDPLSRSYCFLPYGYGYSSPYGYGYDRSVWGYQYPQQQTYNNQNNAYNPQQTYNPSNGSTGNGNMPPSQPPSNAGSPVNVEPQVTRPSISQPSMSDKRGEPQMITPRVD